MKGLVLFVEETPSILLYFGWFLLLATKFLAMEVVFCGSYGYSCPGHANLVLHVPLFSCVPANAGLLKGVDLLSFF